LNSKLNKPMKNKLLLFLLLVLTVTQVSAQTETITNKFTRHPVDLRSGPGAYFEFVSRLNANLQVKVIKEDGTWNEITIDGRKGWVPASSLSEKQGKGIKKSQSAVKNKIKEAFGEIDPDEEQKSLIASKAEVAAAVKGFAKKYKAKKGQRTETGLTSHFENRIDWKAYVDFRKSKIADVTWFHRRRALPLNLDDAPEHDPTLDETGFAIASVLAGAGLVKDQVLLEYLNYLALFMVENSHRDEIPVQIQVLNTDEIAGFAVPGGYIFISKGALKLMNSEAELAHFLAHEVAHLTFEHGMQEYKRRRPRIAASNAFDEMNDTIQDTSNYAKIDEELSEWADEIFDYISKPRLDKYEIEADYWGMVYSYRAGYAPEESISYLTSMKNTGNGYAAAKGKMEWSGVPLVQRINYLQQSLTRLRLRGGETYRQDFQQMKRRLN